MLLRGWMPDHRHGFVRTPFIEEDGEGRYSVEGMLLHMRGHWQLVFDVILDEVRDTVTFDIQL